MRRVRITGGCPRTPGLSQPSGCGSPNRSPSVSPGRGVPAVTIMVIRNRSLKRDALVTEFSPGPGGYFGPVDVVGPVSSARHSERVGASRLNMESEITGQGYRYAKSPVSAAWPLQLRIPAVG